MADQLEQPVEDLEGAAPELPLGEPEMAPEAAMGAPMGAPVEGGDAFDLEALLGEIETAELPPQAAAQPSGSPDDILIQMRAAREALAKEEEFESQDQVTKRFGQIEGELQRLKGERDAAFAQKTRDNINNTINSTVGNELSRLEVDPTTGPGKAFARLLANSAMVAVAKEQTRLGRQDIDLNSVSRQVKNYSKLLERVSTEMAAKLSSKQRRATAGAAKVPVSPSKPVGDMSDEEFDAAVLAAFSNR